MSEVVTQSAFGVSPEPATVRMQRMLPGPIERVWSYLTDSDLRGKWLAIGPMELRVGGKAELTWRNDDLSQRKEDRPARFDAEHRMESQITRVEPPRLLAFTWQGGSEVTFELEPKDGEVLLTVTHRRLPSRDGMLGVSAGWHAHLDILDAITRNRPLPAFWANWERLHAEYDARLP